MTLAVHELLCSTGGANLVINDISSLRLQTYDLPPCDATDTEQTSLQLASGIIERIRAHGHIGLIAGGWVRDRFLGLRSNDIDIATSLSALQMKKMYPKAHQIRSNTVRIKIQEETFEVTTFRGYLREPDLRSASLDAGTSHATHLAKQAPALPR